MVRRTTTTVRTSRCKEWSTKNKEKKRDPKREVDDTRDLGLIQMF